MDDSVNNYLVQLERKSRVVSRRRDKFSKSSRIYRHNHLADHSGIYRTYGNREEEPLHDVPVLRAPKVWRKQRSTPLRLFEGHASLGSALVLIASGTTNHDHYEHVNGLDRERLRVAQSLRDRGRDVDTRYLARAGYRELAQLMS